jgi:hypothetical protein
LLDGGHFAALQGQPVSAAKLSSEDNKKEMCANRWASGFPSSISPIFHLAV